VFISQVLRDLWNASGSDDATVFAALEARLSRPFFQPQDTSNRFAEHYSEVARTLDVPLGQFAEAVRRVNELAERIATEAAADRSIYNVLGARQLTDVSSFAQYAARVADIEGVRRAALVAATLTASGVEATDVPAALVTAELRDPYTNRPFTWDAETRAIVFQGLATGERGEHSIYY
jgi:hypothetical protein